MKTAEPILLPLQRLQQHHDELAHRDILSFDLYKRLKHMVLHFYKYAGKVEAARSGTDRFALRPILLDTFIICMASANALNVSLGARIPLAQDVAIGTVDELAALLAKQVNAPDLYAEALRHFLIVGGAMAKAIESADHMEDGNPRAAMQELLPKLATPVLGLLGCMPGHLEDEIRARLTSVEQRSILLRPIGSGG